MLAAAVGLLFAVTTESFNLGWEFKLADFPISFCKSGLCGTAYKPFYDNGSDAVVQDRVGWTKVDLPHDWALTLPWADSGWRIGRRGFRAIGAKFPENSVGWYRKRFAVPAEADGRARSPGGLVRTGRFASSPCGR